MSRLRQGAAALAAAVLLGCGTPPTFVTGYRMPAQASAAPLLSGGLAVRPLADARPARSDPSPRRIYLALIPIRPWVGSEFQRLDETVRDRSDEVRLNPGGDLGPRMTPAPPFEQYAYPVSMAQAIAQDLAARGWFDRVGYAGEEAAAAAHRYELRGTLRETWLRRSFTSYGFGHVGALFWLTGIPCGRSTARVKLELALVERDGGRTLWQGAPEGSVSRIFNAYGGDLIYGSAGTPSFYLTRPSPEWAVEQRSIFSWHFAALARAMEAAAPEIARALGAGPQGSTGR